MLNPRAMTFRNGICISAYAPEFASKTINDFFASVTKHYMGRSPAEIAKHARGYSEAVKDWPAPRDAMFGWALLQSSVRMQLDQFAEEADAAALEMERAA